MKVPCVSYMKNFYIFYEMVELCAVKEHMPAVIFLLMFLKSRDNWVSITMACHFPRLWMEGTSNKGWFSSLEFG